MKRPTSTSSTEHPIQTHSRWHWMLRVRALDVECSCSCMSKLLLTFYGDDFTGSTDALEQLTLAGIRAALFIEPPTPAQLRRFPELQAVGVAGMTRSLPPGAMEKELRPAFKKLKALGARHVHYKVCSTFDSSPAIGSIGRAIDVGDGNFPRAVCAAARCRAGARTLRDFRKSFRPLRHRQRRRDSPARPASVHQPASGHADDGSDLRLHLAKQTKKKIALFDILKIALPEAEARAALKKILAGKPDVVLFDAFWPEHLEAHRRIDRCVCQRAGGRCSPSARRESRWRWRRSGSGGRAPRAAIDKSAARRARPIRANQILIGSGSCSPVTEGQIAWALKHGFAEVALDAAALASRQKTAGAEIRRATEAAAKLLQTGRSVIVHTSRAGGADARTAAKLKGRTARDARHGARQNSARRAGAKAACAGFDRRRRHVELRGAGAGNRGGGDDCAADAGRAVVPGVRAGFSRRTGCEIVFKGGQVGAENYFET